LWNAALRVGLHIQIGQPVTAASLPRWSQPIAAARPSLCPVVLPGVYEPRTMAGTVLHDVVRTHLDRFLTEMAAATDGAALPRFIEREFRDFLGCGQLDRGFARLRCDACRFERLVPFSCKARAMRCRRSVAAVGEAFCPTLSSSHACNFGKRYSKSARFTERAGQSRRWRGMHLASACFLKNSRRSPCPIA
jgi:hypothetical protein